jgi:hypothetical protein
MASRTHLLAVTRPHSVTSVKGNKMFQEVYLNISWNDEYRMPASRLMDR